MNTAQKVGALVEITRLTEVAMAAVLHSKEDESFIAALATIERRVGALRLELLTEPKGIDL
jgi:hypothetical protein